MTEEEGEVRVRVAVAVVLAPPIGEATWKRAGWRESLGRSLYYALGAGGGIGQRRSLQRAEDALTSSERENAMNQQQRAAKQVPIGICCICTYETCCSLCCASASFVAAACFSIFVP